jgi:hypothetical protein
VLALAASNSCSLQAGTSIRRSEQSAVSANKNPAQTPTICGRTERRRVLTLWHVWEGVLKETRLNQARFYEHSLYEDLRFDVVWMGLATDSTLKRVSNYSRHVFRFLSSDSVHEKQYACGNKFGAHAQEWKSSSEGGG